jgi:dipeptidase D
LEDFCARCGADVSIDEAGNLLAAIGQPHFCLQAHYDMVCLGDQPPVLKEQGEWLMAASGTLGADNGIGVALMMKLIEEGVAGEYLFTNDEEIGLIGAKALALKPQAPWMINLDSEEEGALTIGCAGGEDWQLQIPLTRGAQTPQKPLFLVTTQGFMGGHSGIDIHRDRPSAIVQLLHYLCRLGDRCQIVALKGGERRNAIPRYAEAVIAIDSPPPASSVFTVQPLESHPLAPVVHSQALLDMLLQLPHGVLGWDEANGIASHSSNLALIESLADGFQVDLSVRANRNDLLQESANRLEAFARWAGAAARRFDRYPPWPPTYSQLADRAQAAMRACQIEPQTQAIHAGLECGILSEKLPHMEMISVGPTICEPHTDRERVHLPSLARFESLIRKLCCDLST